MTVLPGLIVLALALGQAKAPPTPAPKDVLPTPPAEPTPDGPVVALETSMGTVRIRLYKTKAPLSTENFLLYVREGFYDGTIFHRVMPSFMVQGGGFTPDMKEKPPTHSPIRNEARNMIRNSRGTVAMARTTDANSATAQFFINLKANHSLDFGIMGAGYAVFAQVLDGMDVVDRIAAVRTGSRGEHENVPDTPVLIKGARIEAEAAPPTQPAAGGR